MAVKVGLIARSEDRGLGILTHAFHRHLRPERTLLVSMGVLAGGWAEHPERYPDATVVGFDGVQLPEGQVREWLAGLDVVYSAETFYDWAVLSWAQAAGVATVLHTMPEFYRHATEHHLSAPTALWTPTAWRLDQLPADVTVVPVPVEDDLWPCTPAGVNGPLRVLHVAGKRAMADRNGTQALSQALRLCRGTFTVTVTTQEPTAAYSRPARGVTVEHHTGGNATRQELYDGQQVLVLPRRYGGLSLPVNEAAGAGLGLVLPACQPNGEDWPCARLVPGTYRGAAQMPAGRVRLYSTSPPALAAVLDDLAGDPGQVERLQADAAAWARGHTWTALAPTYQAGLAAAAAAR